VYVPPHNSHAAKNVSGSKGSLVGSERPNGTRSGGSRSTKAPSSKKKPTGNRGGSSTGPRVTKTTRRNATANTRRTTRNTTAGAKQACNTTKERDSFFDPNRWPIREFDMICGDINAHSILWDDTRANKEPDQRGIVVEDWLADNNMLAVNDGKPTHDSRSAGTASAPDVTLVHTTMMDKVTWETVNDLSSDHRPIIITYRDHFPKVNNKPTFKWKLKEADWTKFREEVENKIPARHQKKNINKVEKLLRKAFLKAANKQEEGNRIHQMLHDRRN